MLELAWFLINWLYTVLVECMKMIFPASSFPKSSVQLIFNCQSECELNPHILMLQRKVSRSILMTLRSLGQFKIVERCQRRVRKALWKHFFVRKKSLPTSQMTREKQELEGTAWLLPDKLMSSMISGWKSASIPKFNRIKELGLFPVD